MGPVDVYEHQSAETMAPSFLLWAGMVRSKSGLTGHLLSKWLIGQVNSLHFGSLDIIWTSTVCLKSVHILELVLRGVASLER